MLQYHGENAKTLMSINPYKLIFSGDFSRNNIAIISSECAEKMLYG